MVKPIFKIRDEMKAAKNGQEAYDIGIAFLKSELATQSSPKDDQRAGVFAKELEGIFAKHQTPELCRKLLLEAESQDYKLSFGLRTSLGCALTDFNASANYLREAAPLLLQNAAILKGLKSPQSSAFEFAKHYHGDDIAESSPPAFPELLMATNADEFQAALNQIMLENEIADERVPIFFKAVMDGFRALEIPVEKQIELLTFMQDGPISSAALHNLFVDKAVKLTNELEGPLPRTAHQGGRDMSPQ